MYRETQRQVAAAGITVFSILLEQPDTDASNRRPGGVEGYLSTDLDDGPSNFASMTGGKYFQTDGLEPSLYSVKVQMREGIVDLGTITREIRIE